MRRGVSLLEVIVAAGLLTLVLVLAFGYLLPATRAAGRYQTRSHMNQVALVVLGKIEQAASETSPGGVSWSFADPVAVGFNPVDSLQPANALLLWSQKYQIFWWDETENTLNETNWPPGPPTQAGSENTVARAKRLLAGRLQEITSQAPQRKTLAQGVTKFEISHPGTDTVLIQPITVTLELTELGREDRDDKQVLSQTLTFRTINRK